MLVLKDLVLNDLECPKFKCFKGSKSKCIKGSKVKYSYAQVNPAGRVQISCQTLRIEPKSLVKTPRIGSRSLDNPQE